MKKYTKITACFVNNWGLTFTVLTPTDVAAAAGWSDERAAPAGWVLWSCNLVWTFDTIGHMWPHICERFHKHSVVVWSCNAYIDWVGRKSHRACCLCSNMWEITHNSIGNSGVLSTAFRVNGYRHLPCSVIAWQHLDRSTVQRKNSQGNRGNTDHFMSVISWIKSTHTITFSKTSSPHCNLLAPPTLCAGASTLNLFEIFLDIWGTEIW